MNPLKEKLQSLYSGKRVLVVGLGVQGGGSGVAAFFAELGATVIVTDIKTEKQLEKSMLELKNYPIVYHLGSHDIQDFLSADIIFKGPRVPWTLPEIQQALKKHIPVEMETAFFASLCPAPIIGITGTRGKSTTTMMIYEIAKLTGKKVHLAGNLPNVSSINTLYSIRPDDLVVLELSSWQLSGFHRKKISPHIAVFTNLYPDHLDYYSSMNEYLFDKKGIYMYQKKDDVLFANERLSDFIKTDKHEGKISFFSSNTYPGKLDYLKGDHNKENAAAAYLVGRFLRCEEEKLIYLLNGFKGIPSRQEQVGQKNGVIFVNDTTSTTPVATEIAIRSFSDYPFVLILGGNSKGLPYENLLKEVKKVSYVVLLKGTFTEEILESLKKDMGEKVSPVFENLEQAVMSAFEKAQHLKKNNSDSVYVLLSPGATSFAMFRNEFHRGEVFNSAVKKITATV